jgi:DNA-directed RNA polymerase subunit RPC12/RpoP
MTAYICETCGTQFAETETPPARCPICDEYRQYVGPRGQVWTTMPQLVRGYRNAWRQHLPDMFSIETLPAFGIAQRAFLLRTPAGNVLWDCLTLLDDATAALIDSLGGLKAVAISHPHYYSSMGGWGERFNCPVLLHEADREWVMRPHPSLAFWSGETKELLPGLTLVCCGGHYPGGAVLHWDKGDGVLLCGDILQVAPDRKFISVMRSYPNMLPVSAPAIDRIANVLTPFAYGKVYGAFTGREIVADGKERVAVSLRRYRDAITGDGSAELL